MAQKRKAPVVRTVVRDSGSGQFVPKQRAKTHPKTTETEKIRRK